MKKLNNKGMTAVEILVCFVLVVIISVSMYTTVSSYQNKQQIEAFKEKIFTYKNLLTKEINDDLIKDGLVTAKITNYLVDPDSGDADAIIEMNMRNGDKKCLKITSKKAYDYFYDPSEMVSTDEGDKPMGEILPVGEDKDDEFLISYGFCGNETEYPIPDLGSSKNPNGKKIYDLRINNVEVEVEKSLLSVYVGFYHPDLGTRYGIDIVCPVNF